MTELADSPRKPTRTIGAFELVGGHPALDFVNTVDWRGRANPNDHILSYHALLRWMRHAGLLERQASRSLLDRSRTDPGRAVAVLKDVLDLREASYRIFVARARHRRASQDDVRVVNRMLALFSNAGQVASTKDGYVWARVQQKDPLAEPVERLARLVAELLVSGDLRNVRMCDGPGCGWVFLNKSANRLRRWCSMSACGNRAKARRHRSRGAQADRV